MKNVSLLIVLAAGVALGARAAEPAASGTGTTAAPVVVGVKEVAPFAMKTADGQWRGISIELWEEMARRLDLTYELREYALDELLAATAAGEVQLALGAITVTAERERRVDFTQPYFQSSLSIAVPQEQRSGPGAFFQALISPAFLAATGSLLLVLAVVGALVWLIERRRNPDFQGSTLQGLGDGLWWSAVTMTTVGYGDKAPRTLPGRALGIVWMFASIIIIASMTGAIASAFTVSELQARIQGPEDLVKFRVATVAGSTSEGYLANERVRHRSFATLPEALQAVVSGASPAVVYDAPALKYLVNDRYGEVLDVLSDEFQPEYYAFAIPPHSDLREPFNRELISIIQSPGWRDVLYGFFGE